MKYPNAAKGIKKIYLAEILSILAVVLLIAIVIMMAVSNVDTSMSGEAVTQALETAKVGTPFVILSAAMMLIMLVSYVLNFIGLSRSRIIFPDWIERLMSHTTNISRKLNKLVARIR